MKRKHLNIKTFIPAALAIIIAGAGFSLRAQTDSAQRREVFEQVWTTINEKYYDASFNGVDWQKVKEKYLGRIEKADDDKSFYALLDEMAGELRDSHTRVYSPEQREARKKQRRTSIGISIKQVENAVVIASVAKGSEAEKSGIKPGMVVRAVNNQPIKKAIAEAVRTVGVSSSERATEMRVYSKILSGEPDTFLKITLSDEKGKRRNFTLKRVLVSNAPQISTRILPSGIAYLKFNHFDESIEDQLAEALENFKNAPALILDLRGNAGGDGEMSLRFAGKFFDKKTAVARIVTRSGKPPIEGMPMTLETGETGRQIFSNPLAVLIDERTASTAELITNAFQETNRAKIFGTNSCGCVLAFLGYKPLKGGGDMTLSEFGFITSKHKTLEGAGITPDRTFAPTLRDLRTGRDAPLEEAEKYLKALK